MKRKLKRNSNRSVKEKRTYNYKKKIPEIAEKKRRSRKYWEISFTRNDRFELYTMSMIYIDIDGNIIHCEDRPSNVILTHKAMTFKSLRSWIIKNDDILRRWHVRLEADFVYENTQKEEK